MKFETETRIAAALRRLERLKRAAETPERGFGWELLYSSGGR